MQVPRFLLEAGAKINLETTLSVAAGFGDIEIVCKSPILKIIIDANSLTDQRKQSLRKVVKLRMLKKR